MKSVRKIIRPAYEPGILLAIREEIVPIERSNVSLAMVRAGLPIINMLKQIIYDFCQRQSKS